MEENKSLLLGKLWKERETGKNRRGGRKLGTKDKKVRAILILKLCKNC